MKILQLQLQLPLLLLMANAILPVHCAPIVAGVAQTVASAIRGKIQSKAKERVSKAITTKKGGSDGNGDGGPFKGAKVVYLLLPVTGQALTPDQLPLPLPIGNNEPAEQDAAGSAADASVDGSTESEHGGPATATSEATLNPQQTEAAVNPQQMAATTVNPQQIAPNPVAIDGATNPAAPANTANATTFASASAPAPAQQPNTVTASQPISIPITLSQSPL